LKPAIPSIGKVYNQAADYGARQADTDIRPSHSRVLRAVNYQRFVSRASGSDTWKDDFATVRTLVVLPLSNILKIIDPSIVKVLPWEDGGIQISRVRIGDRMA